MPDEMSIAFPDPLHDLNDAAGAEFQPYDPLDIVSTFAEPQAEYAAIRKGCAIIDEPQRGIIELTGRDRLPFLNNLLTNQTWDKDRKTPLAPGTGVYAFPLDRAIFLARRRGGPGRPYRVSRRPQIVGGHVCHCDRLPSRKGRELRRS